MNNIPKKEIAKYIDHTLLKPDANIKDIEKLCNEADNYNFASVCVNPHYIKYCAEKLKDSDAKVVSVIGFPLGANTTEIKKAEVIQAVKDGADELDMVINIGSLKSGDYENVFQDIKSVVEVAEGKCVKVIIETCLLTESEKIKACELSKKAGANFVKTSTGFSSNGATVEDVKLMKKIVGEKMQVKASGGIHSYEEAIAMIEAGASRLGASAGVKIIS
ncbi:MAG: deoxyribose-phosphate aldolase [Candidatus Marinimicrobia bacterium]|jgi:deoxyribose-phosphate aldolase|nr:deoxyribose-phosphate aldolase [Candidatus Neomarinimicrobiota bacterium]